jgi:hypothetical protein
MRRTTLTAVVAALSTAAASAAPLAAQSAGGMDHSSHASHAPGNSSPMATAPTGQDAYAAIAAIVARLEADSTTDWSRVNIEALRRHLIAMNDVTLGATAVQTAIPGGARMDVTGAGRVAESIRAMLRAHAPELEALGQYRASVENIPGGARLTVTAGDASDATTVAKIRALGFMGLLTLGAHHTAHHEAMARGEATAGHRHE